VTTAAPGPSSEAGAPAPSGGSKPRKKRPSESGSGSRQEVVLGEANAKQQVRAGRVRI